jgi:hypothetical protein
VAVFAVGRAGGRHAGRQPLTPATEVDRMILQYTATYVCYGREPGGAQRLAILMLTGDDRRGRTRRPHGVGRRERGDDDAA